MTYQQVKSKIEIMLSDGKAAIEDFGAERISFHISDVEPEIVEQIAKDYDLKVQAFGTLVAVGIWHETSVHIMVYSTPCKIETTVKYSPIPAQK